MRRQLINEILRLWQEDVSKDKYTNIRNVLDEVGKKTLAEFIDHDTYSPVTNTIALHTAEEIIRSLSMMTDMLDTLPDDVLQDAAGYCHSCVSAPCKCKEASNEVKKMEMYNV